MPYKESEVTTVINLLFEGTFCMQISIVMTKQGVEFEKIKIIVSPLKKHCKRLTGVIYLELKICLQLILVSLHISSYSIMHRTSKIR